MTGIANAEQHAARNGRSVARWIVALADPDAAWITGQVITVDGGLRGRPGAAGPLRCRAYRTETITSGRARGRRG